MASKRERQRQVKEQKQKAAQQKQKTVRIMSKVGLFVVAPVLALFVVYTLLSQGRTYSPVEIAPDDHLRGEPEAPVSIVMYADFQCPACATEFQTFARVWPQIQGQSHLIYRHYPLTTTHQHSWTASLYAEAASRQGMFWQMHDFLFSNQAIWSGLPEVEEEFDSYALQLNLDLDRLHADMELEEVAQKIRNDQRGGTRSGVRSTPTLFINGRMVGQPSAQRLIQLVQEEFESASAGN